MLCKYVNWLAFGLTGATEDITGQNVCMHICMVTSNHAHAAAITHAAVITHAAAIMHAGVIMHAAVIMHAVPITHTAEITQALLW